MDSHTDSVSTGEGDDEGGMDKKSLGFFLCLSLLCGAVIILTAVLVLIFTGAYGFDKTQANPEESMPGKSLKEWSASGRERIIMPKEPDKPMGIRVKLKFLASDDMRQLQQESLDEAKDYCEKRKKRLPVPMNEAEELQMLKDIQILHETAKCNYYAIGYKLDLNMRYMSLNEKKIWPSLRKDKTAGTDSKTRDCIQVGMKNKKKFQIIDSKPCNEVTSFNDVTGFNARNEMCATDIWGKSCLDYIHSNKNMEKTIEFRLSKPENKFVGVMLLDREMIPLKLLARGREENSWMFEVKYVTNYLDLYESNLAPYKVNVTIFQDPERDCIAINSQKNFQIETVLCDHVGCPACEEMKLKKWT